MTRYGPDRLQACPRCATPLAVPTLLSGNTGGAVLWSDGHFQAPMLPLPDPLARCPACADFFWRDELVGEGEAPSGLPRVRGRLTLEDLHAALDGLTSGTEQDLDRQRTVRRLLWWRRNDPLRQRAMPGGCLAAAIVLSVAVLGISWRQPWAWGVAMILAWLVVHELTGRLRARRVRRIAQEERSSAESDFARELELLLPLFRPDVPEERLSRAEALRQLARHEEALKALSEMDEPVDQTLASWLHTVRAGALEGDILPRPVPTAHR